MSVRKSARVAMGGRSSAWSCAHAWRRSRSARDSMSAPRSAPKTPAQVRRRLTSNGKPKPAEIKTDREIDEAIAQRAAVVRVKLGLGPASRRRFGARARTRAALARSLHRGKPTMPRALTVAALASVPGAVRSLVTAVVAWRQPSVVPNELDSLVRFPTVIPAGHPGARALVRRRRCLHVVVGRHPRIRAVRRRRA